MSIGRKAVEAAQVVGGAFGRSVSEAAALGREGLDITASILRLDSERGRVSSACSFVGNGVRRVLDGIARFDESMPERRS